MMRRILIVSVSALALAACATAPEPTRLVGSSPVIPTMGIDPIPQQLRPIPSANRGQGTVAPIAAIAAANRQARAHSTPAGFVAAMQVFDYVPGELYQVFLSPGYVTTIQLQQDENLYTVAAGDTARWQISRTPGDGQRPVILVKPLRPGIATNLALITASRTYLLELHALAEGAPYNAAISWTYGDEGFGAVTTVSAGSRSSGADVDMNYSIHVASGSRPDWTPTLAFVNGGRFYIRFPADIGAIPAPTLFAVGSDGQPHLVNYRINGHSYEVDRPLDTAELRLADTVVRIERGR